MIGLLLGMVGVIVGAPGVKREWGLGAAIAFGALGVLVSLFVPFGGVGVMVAGGALHRVTTNRNLERVAAEADREFRQAQVAAAVTEGGPPAPLPEPPTNPYHPPKQS